MRTFCIYMCVCATLSTRAEFIVAPSDRALQSGNTSTHFGFQAPSTYQNVYGARNFSQPVEIHGIAFRQNEGSLGLSVDVEIPRVQIRLSTYSGSYASFRENRFAYDDNKGPDDIVAFDGSVHWTTTDLPGSGPNPFDLKIHFSQPFTYDPAKGFLLMNFLTSGNFTSGLSVDSHGHNDVTIGWSGGIEPGNLITQFDVIPIPEPCVLALSAFGAAVIVICRRRS